MTYSAIYCALIEKRRQNPLEKTGDGTVESHHIIPKSEGGSDDSINIVNLTLREHYIAHLLLAKIYNDRYMASAILLLSGKNHHYNSRLYEFSRCKFASYMVGHSVSEETRMKMSISAKKRCSTREGILRLSLCRKGKCATLETRRRISIASSKRKHTEETRKKISVANKGKQRTPRQIEAVRQHSSRPVLKISPDGVFVCRFSSMVEAAKTVGCSPSAISCCVRGVVKLCRGFKWRYAEVNSDAEKN